MQKNTYSLSDSPEYQALREITLENGSDELADGLTELLYLLNAPPNLTKFLYLCRHRLPGILEYCDELKYDRFKTELFDRPREWLEWFNANDDLFDSNPITRELMKYEQETRYKNPLEGHGYVRYGLYAAFFHSLSDEDAYPGWAIMGMMLWISQAQVLKDHFPRETYLAFRGGRELLGDIYRIYNASLRLRRLSDDEYREFQIILTREFKLAGAGNKIAVLSALSNIPNDGSYMKPVLTYIKKALGISKWRGKKSSRVRRHKSKRKKLPPGYIDLGDGIELFVATEKDDEKGGGYVEVLAHAFTPEEIDKLIEEDIDPWELEDGSQLSLFETECETTNKNVMSRVLSARGRQQHIRMHNQLLPWQRHQLSLGEVTELYRYLSSACDAIEEAGIQSRDDSNRLEIPLLIMVMLVTGSHIERAIKLTVLKQGQKTSDVDIFIFSHKDDVADENIRHEWGMQAFEPKYETDPLYESRIRKKKIKSFYVPDFLGVAPYVIRYRSLSQTNVKKSRTVFQKQINTYKKAIKAYLKTIPVEVSDRLTMSNIGKYLLYQVAAATNDITAASCITAQGHHLAGTRIHYSSLSIDYLREVLKKALEPLMRNLGKDPDEIKIIQAKFPTYVGARHCLTTLSYQEAIKQVIGDIHAQKGIKNLQELIEHHNLYTAYTAWMFNFGVAGRANANPLLSLSQFDARSGVSTYREKDFEKPYHARMIWLPPEVRRQLSNYEEHLSALRAVIAMYLDLDKEPLYKGMGFFLKRNLKPDKIRSVTMKEYLYKRYLNAPNNSHRRYLRSELVEMGHPVESIDALLGHWFSGEEPWSYFSTFDFGLHIEQLKKNLIGIMNQIGFRACQSSLMVGKL